MSIVKYCSRCSKSKPLDEFSNDRSRKDGKHCYCRLCRNQAHNDWRRNNPEKVRKYARAWYKKNRIKCQQIIRKRKLKVSYGITPEDYDGMLLNQNNTCAVCKQACKTGNLLAVDHDHITGKIRGLLCARCNITLGLVQDNSKLLQELINYLDKNNVKR